MALSAFHASAEENTSRVRHVIEVHTRIADVVSRRRVIENQSMAADELFHQIVVVRIDSDLLPDPSLVLMTPVYVDPEAQNVSPELEVMSCVSGIVFQ